MAFDSVFSFDSPRLDSRPWAMRCHHCDKAFREGDPILVFSQKRYFHRGCVYSRVR